MSPTPLLPPSMDVADLLPPPPMEVDTTAGFLRREPNTTTTTSSARPPSPAHRSVKIASSMAGRRWCRHHASSMAGRRWCRHPWCRHLLQSAKVMEEVGKGDGDVDEDWLGDGDVGDDLQWWWQVVFNGGSLR
ncbi:hypothetical protein Dimus_000231 [Dionaea muscipula]